MPDPWRRRWRRVKLLPYALIAPIGLLLLAISVYPSLYAIWLAMTDASLLRLARAKFIGIDNFVRLAGDPVFLDSLWRTLRWDVAVVGIELAIALPIALFLNLTFRGRGIRPRGDDDSLHHAAGRRRAAVRVHVRRQFRRRQRHPGQARPSGSLRVVAERSNREASR